MYILRDNKHYILPSAQTHSQLVNILVSSKMTSLQEPFIKTEQQEGDTCRTKENIICHKGGDLLLERAILFSHFKQCVFVRVIHELCLFTYVTNAISFIITFYLRCCISYFEHTQYFMDLYKNLDTFWGLFRYVFIIFLCLKI